MVLVDEFSRTREPVVEPGLVRRKPAFQMREGSGSFESSVIPFGPGRFIAAAGPYSFAVSGASSRTSEANERPSPYHHQCSAVCEETPKRRPRARAAVASSPTTSRCGPIAFAFHGVMSESYMAKPSQCSATGTMYRAPACANRSTHAAGSKCSARNIGIKSLYPKVVCGP